MKKFSTTGRARIVAAALVVAAAGVFASVGMAGFGAKLVGMSHTSTPTAQQYPAGKVTICHHTHSQKNPFVTITVSQNAVAAHVRNHGDTIGPCSEQAAPVVPVVPGQAKKAVKVHKAHKAKHANKGQLRRNSKSKTKHESTQANDHANKGVGHKPTTTAPSTSHGKGQAKGHSKTHGPPAGHGNGQGNGNGNGHDKSQNDHGQGHGQENGHSNNPGSGGNGKGKGH
ncbi:MAG TPA: hypothetical protein VLZ04_09755 [Gaiellaceae bacterium]|jgi:hypothetical protein|nr:hypothetical protein [Gaiellaceae bacterium]